ncbi:rab guanine nucleotide exchange factor S2 [Linnemannia exigua]|uniref:Rab guanine nucleotide exchange factor S2 n=1 Tax=Linnemannia exigua TaxID=604196 RepID=A0AAD4H253_9FUNG|nr:rab guanine nucleotide exchange factor S2 [Linnemannia exigua]
MSATCNNCGAAVQLDDTKATTPSAAAVTAALLLKQPQPLTPDDPLIPYVKAQIDDLTAQNSNLVAENDSLSSKLVESTEGRMDLDQQLTITQMELQVAQKEIKVLQASQKHYEQLLAMISSGQLIEKKDVQPVIENLAYESQRRSQIESSKLKLESELEDLSKSLFEEANRMVNEERQATYMAGKKVESLERQLDEVLDLCKSERDQLVELKGRMEKLSEEKDLVQRERDAFEFALVQLQQQKEQQLQHAQMLNSSSQHMSNSAAIRRGMSSPSTSAVSGSASGAGTNGNTTPPGLNVEIASTIGSRKQVPHYDPRYHRSSAASSVKSKTDSCYFSDGDHPGSHLPNDPNEDKVPSLGFHLWDPSFIEFKTYMESLFGTGAGAGANRKVSTDSRTLHTPNPSIASSGITSMYSFNLMMTKATTPAAPPAANAVIPINTLLSNCKLLKKMSAEDVEATLRFEPGNLLSWTQRKRLMTAVTDNTLVVEAVPMNPNHHHHHSGAPSPVAVAASGQLLAPGTANTATTMTSTASRPNCALCGHSITTPLSYQYRLTDTANESRTICPYCRTRLTSVCTFYSVLRMISKRIISSTTTPEKLYLDFLRIRLGMFMARCGVGIVTGEEVKVKRPESGAATSGNAAAAAAALGRNQVLMSAAAAVASAHAHATANGHAGLPPRASDTSADAVAAAAVAALPPVPVSVSVPISSPAPASTVMTTNIIPVQASMLLHPSSSKGQAQGQSPKSLSSPSMHETGAMIREEDTDEVSFMTASPAQDVAVLVRS